MPARGSKSRLSDDEAAAWKGFLRTHARVLRELDADLMRSHGLAASSYDVLIALGLAPGRRLRLTELAGQIVMSPSGLTRVLNQLEREGLIEREQREDDARSFDAVLTPEGRTRLRAANETHLRKVRQLFLDHLSDAQLKQLASAWHTVDAGR